MQGAVTWQTQVKKSCPNTAARHGATEHARGAVRCEVRQRATIRCRSPHGLVVAHVALDVDVVGLHHLPGGADEILDLPDEELHLARATLNAQRKTHAVWDNTRNMQRMTRATFARLPVSFKLRSTGESASIQG